VQGTAPNNPVPFRACAVRPLFVVDPTGRKRKELCQVSLCLIFMIFSGLFSSSVALNLAVTGFRAKDTT